MVSAVTLADSTTAPVNIFTNARIESGVTIGAMPGSNSIPVDAKLAAIESGSTVRDARMYRSSAAPTSRRAASSECLVVVSHAADVTSAHSASRNALVIGRK